LTTARAFRTRGENTGKEGKVMKITISRPVMGINGRQNEPIVGLDGKELSFPTVKETINFLADRNCTIEDLRELDFDIEAEKDETCLA
jgi:hypothetical protein